MKCKSRRDTEVEFCDLDALLASPVPRRPRTIRRPPPIPGASRGIERGGEIDVRGLLTGEVVAVPGERTEVDAPQRLYAVLAVMVGVIVGLLAALMLVVATRGATRPSMAQASPRPPAESVQTQVESRTAVFCGLAGTC